MAHILPETPPQTFPREVLRVFHALKALPDTFYIWHHLAPWRPEAPDFLVLHEDEPRAAGQGQFSRSQSGQHCGPDAACLMIITSPLGQAEAQVLKAFLDFAVLCQIDQPIETLVVFPNIPDKQVQASRLERGRRGPGLGRKGDPTTRDRLRGVGSVLSIHSNRSDLVGKTPPALHTRK